MAQRVDRRVSRAKAQEVSASRSAYPNAAPVPHPSSTPRTASRSTEKSSSPRREIKVPAWFRGRGMNQRGVHSQGTTGGEDRVFITKVSIRPTVARNRTRTQWRPRRPNGKGFVNIGPKFPFTVGEEGVARRYLPGTMGPILVGKKGSKGQTRPPRHPWPAVMRSASRRGGGSRPPPPHSECSARPPTVPPGPLRPTHDPEAPAGSPGA